MAWQRFISSGFGQQHVSTQAKDGTSLSPDKQSVISPNQRKQLSFQTVGNFATKFLQQPSILRCSWWACCDWSSKGKHANDNRYKHGRGSRVSEESFAFEFLLFFVCVRHFLCHAVRTWRRVTTHADWILIPRKRRRCKWKGQIKFMSSKEIRSTASAFWRKCQDEGRRGNSVNETTKDADSGEVPLWSGSRIRWQRVCQRSQ